MRRRDFWMALFAAPIAMVAQSPGADVPKTWDNFATEANGWANLRLGTPLGAYSWGAKRHWDERVKPAFRAVDIAVKNE